MHHDEQAVRKGLDPRFRGENGRKQGPLPRFTPLSSEGEDRGALNLSPEGEVPEKPG